MESLTLPSENAVGQRDADLRGRGKDVTCGSAMCKRATLKIAAWGYRLVSFPVFGD